MINKKGIILMSVDSPRRDLEWRIFLAKKFTDLGYTVLVGTKNEIKKIHHSSKNCIFLGRFNSNNGRSERDKKYFKNMIKRNTRIFFYHDEGAFGSQSMFEEDVIKTHPIEYLSYSKFIKLLTWGVRQKEELIKQGVSNDRIEVVGCAGLELAKRERKFNSNLNKKVTNKDKYILLVSRFPNLHNSKEGKIAFLSNKMLNILKLGGVSNPEENLSSLWCYITHVFADYIKFTKDIIRLLPDEKFIVRPHPQEDCNFYNVAFSNYSNVTINNSGDFVDLLSNAKYVIASECTTLLESEVMGKKIINFQPKLYQDYNMPVIGLRDLKPSIATVHEAIDIVKGDEEYLHYLYSTKNKTNKSISNYASNYIDEVDAIENIVNVVDKYASTEVLNSEIRMSSKIHRYIFSFVFNSGIYKFTKAKNRFQVLGSKKEMNRLFKKYFFDKNQVLFSERLLLFSPKK